MADDDEEVQVQSNSLTKDQQEQNKRMGTEELSNNDTSKSLEAVNNLKIESEKNDKMKADREKQLASIKINEADINVLISEFEITYKEADYYLRLNNGELIKTINYCLNK